MTYYGYFTVYFLIIKYYFIFIFLKKSTKYYAEIWPLDVICRQLGYEKNYYNYQTMYTEDNHGHKYISATNTGACSSN